MSNEFSLETKVNGLPIRYLIELILRTDPSKQSDVADELDSFGFCRPEIGILIKSLDKNESLFHVELLADKNGFIIRAQIWQKKLWNETELRRSRLVEAAAKDRDRWDYRKSKIEELTFALVNFTGLDRETCQKKVMAILEKEPDKAVMGFKAFGIELDKEKI